jgi:ribonuclease T2
MRSAVLTVLFSLCIAADTAGAAPRQITGAGFTYYVLSLFWLPTLCLESPGADECQGVRHDGFTVHGLQPTLNYNSPVNCGGDDVLSEALVTRMKNLIPTRKLMEREWAQHGSCSGLAPDQFFTALRKAYESVNIPPLSQIGSDSRQTIHDITKAFTRRDPGLPAQAVALTCSENPARLREVRICLSKDLASTYCSGEIIQSSCRTLYIQIPAPP